MSPQLSTAGIARHSITEAVSAATESKAHAVRDILARAARGDGPGMVESFEAILTGASPDDVLKLRELLREARGGGAAPLPGARSTVSWRTTGAKAAIRTST